MYPWMITAGIFSTLLLSSYLDLKKREIPIELYFFYLIPLAVIGQLFSAGPPLWEAIAAALVWGAVYLVLAMYCGGGGGDIVMMAVLAFCIGKSICLVVIFCMVGMVAYGLVKRDWKMAAVPYAPFVLISFTIERILFFCWKG